MALGRHGTLGPPHLPRAQKGLLPLGRKWKGRENRHNRIWYHLLPLTWYQLPRDNEARDLLGIFYRSARTREDQQPAGKT